MKITNHPTWHRLPACTPNPQKAESLRHFFYSARGLRRLPKILALGLCAAFLCSDIGNLSAQTTLSGDHVITGDLNVGTSVNKGNLEVTGETGSTAGPGLKVTGDGGVVFGGTHGTGSIPATGPGSRLMWFPGKSAFRGGRAVSNEFDNYRIGEFSFAFGGQWVLATGIASSAIGFHASASGDYSTAIGAHVIASGYGSSALSGGQAEGWFASALSSGSATEPYSAAFSQGIASGWAATAMSYGVALNNAATAISEGNALGYGSLAARGGTAEGFRSVAIGDGAYAQAAYSIVLGRNNIREGNPENVWVPTDPLFVIGYGTGDPAAPPEIRNRNAFTVYKNGDAKFGGAVHIPAKGDISMGPFTN